MTTKPRTRSSAVMAAVKLSDKKLHDLNQEVIFLKDIIEIQKIMINRLRYELELISGNRVEKDDVSDE